MGRITVVNADVGSAIMDILDDLVTRTGKSKSEVVREAIVAYHYHSLYSWAGTAKLIDALGDKEEVA